MTKTIEGIREALRELTIALSGDKYRVVLLREPNNNCPRCGGRFCEVKGPDPSHGGKYAVVCDDCCLTGPMTTDREMAVMPWDKMDAKTEAEP